MKGYIHIDNIYGLISGHSNYHGDDILSALTCIAEGKDVTKPITPLDEQSCSDEEFNKIINDIKSDINQIITKNKGIRSVEAQERIRTAQQILDIINKHTKRLV